MANQLYAGFVYDDAGAAIVGATVNLFTRNTTTPVQATTTTDSNGYWAITHATEGRFDVEIVNGTSKRRRKYDDQVQFDTLEVATLRVRNPADTFDYDIVPAAIVADRQLTLPLITGTDTLATLGLAATFSAQQTFSEIIASAKGISFPATQVASANANTLDDHEEGTWTPIASPTGTATYTTQTGTYVKQGKWVSVTCYLVINLIGTGDPATLGGLPFASRNLAAAAVQSIHIGHFTSLAINTIFLAGYIENNATTVKFTDLATSGPSMTNASSPLGNSATLYFSATYEAAA